MPVNVSGASTRSLHMVYSTCAKQFGEKKQRFFVIDQLF